MIINDVPKEGSTYTLDYSFSDGNYSRTITVTSNVNWITATVNTSRHTITVVVNGNSTQSSREGTLTPKVNGDSCSTSTIYVSQKGSDTPPTPTGVLTCDDLITQFNGILTERNKNAVQNGSAVYEYLCSSYNTAVAEYNNPNSKYFNKDTYEEVFVDERSQWGSNAKYETDGTALNAMTSWLMAMQLAELVPDSGVSTNTQTELYSAAYNIFQGNNYAWRIPLYDNYTLKGDPAITRIVAGALYCEIRSNYSFNQIDNFRSALGGSVINNVYANSSLGWYEDEYEGAPYCLSYSRRIGYGVNANLVLPPAPGPYVSQNGWCEECATLDSTTRLQLSNRTYCKAADSQGTGHCSHGMLENFVGSSYFNSQHNYKFDEYVDSYVTSHYNLNSDCCNYKLRTVQAIADANEEVTHFFANTTYYRHGVGTESSNRGCYNESFIPGSPTDNDGYFKGVFNCGITGKDLSTIWNSGPNESDISKFFGRIHHGVSALRATLLFDQFGRMRPGGANSGGYDKQPRSTSQYNLNNLGDSTISLLGLGTTQYDDNGTPYYYYVDTNGNGHRADWYDGTVLVEEPQYNPNEEPPTPVCYHGANGMRSHTYPSGHNAGAWTVTMIMMEILPSKAKEIYRAGYSYGVSRTIVRAHWNSDTVYGKFIAMMDVPIYHSVEVINSSSKKDGELDPIESYTGRFRVRDGFTLAKTVITGASSSCDINKEIVIKVRIKNNLTSSINITNEAVLYVANPDKNGNYYGNEGTYTGCYNRVPDGCRFIFSDTASRSVAGNGGTTGYFKIRIPGSSKWKADRGFAPNLDVNACVDGKGGPATLYKADGSGESIQHNSTIRTKITSDNGYKVSIPFAGYPATQCEKIVDGGTYTITIYQ